MKAKKILPIFILVLLLTGCNPKTGKMTCTMSSYPTDGITLRSTYIAKYKNNVVTNLKTVEEITAENKDNLAIYKDKIKELYKGYKGINYYKNSLKQKGHTLTSITTIEYDKVNTKKLIEVNSGNASIIKNRKVNIDDLKRMYKRNGCNCKKEG